MSKPQRTRSGCWTCRVRRKKCEGGGPPCNTCFTRGITCHGYGPKPAWKDRGEKEKEELKKILQACSFNGRRRPRSISHSLEKAQDASVTDVGVLSPRTTVTSPDTSAGAVDFGLIDSASTGFLNLETLLTSEIWEESASSYQSAFESLGSEQDLTGSLNSNIAMTSTETMLNFETPMEFLFPTPPSSLADVRRASQETSSAQSSHSSTDNYAYVTDSADLTMSYLLHTFSLQFPYYTSKDKLGWLLMMMHNSAAFAKSCLSIAGYHRMIEGSTEYNRQHGFDTIKSYAKQSKNLLLAYGSPDLGNEITALIEELACYMQLICAENLLGSQEGWHPLFDRACDIYSKIACSSTSCLPMPYYNAGQVFGSMLVVTHILNNTLSLTGLQSPLPYRNALNQKTVEVETVLGCENWVMLLLMDIQELETWKLFEQESGSLSIVKLVGRAEKIELEAQQKLKVVGELVHQTSEEQHKHRHLVTSIYAHAAIIYLHTVVSGANPSVPEVQNAVQAAVAAWRLLPKSFPLHALKWPYCVTASLSTGQDRPFFGSLVASTTMEIQSFGNFIQLRKIVEDCWQQSDSQWPHARHDWRQSVTRLGIKPLLV